MRLILNDTVQENFEKILVPEANDIVFSNDELIKRCIGCFGCWTKNPGLCVIKDHYENIGQIISQCNEIVIISECCYGGYSPFIKKVLERSIAFVEPLFTIRNKELHHKSRYDNDLNLSVIFYGDNISDEEKKVATELVNANAINYNIKAYTIQFMDKMFKGEK